MAYRTKKMVIMGMLVAIAYVLVVFIRIPMVMFLKYEPKDIIIVIGAFIFGPLEAIIISIIVSIIEMLTISSTGIIGAIMNIISTSSFVLVAGLIYKKRKNKKSAIIGMLLGTLLMTIVMLMWNYLLTPLYLEIPRAELVKLLIPAILPFNIIKGSINTVITIIIYKPIVNSLRKAGLIPKDTLQN